MKSNKASNRITPSIDQVIALLILPLILILLGLLYLVVVPLQGRPFFFAAERMRGPLQGFNQLKIRTMLPVDRIFDQSAMGGDLCHRVTPIGRFLRKTRLDELPQIFNVLRGEMVFIGPRPPLRIYVESCPEYAHSLTGTLPGITGLATVLLHAREERILSECKNAVETDQAYRAYCIPLKIRLDEMYRRKKTLRLKLFILWRTVSRLDLKGAIFGVAKTVWDTNRQLDRELTEYMYSHPSRSARLK